MSSGVDASSSCSPIAQNLVQAGKTFVCRYYANSGKKRLTLSEAQALTAAGLKIVTVWEDGHPTVGGYFSYSKGVDDGTSAYHDAMLIGQPAKTPIYFAVDFDASQAEIAGAIGDYFRGVADGFNTIGGGNSAHLVGVYGSGSTCGWLLNRELAQYSWLAMSSGWSGFGSFSEWNIKQGEGTPIGGVDLDFDEGVADIGAFVIP